MRESIQDVVEPLIVSGEAASKGRSAMVSVNLWCPSRLLFRGTMVHVPVLIDHYAQ